MNPPEFVLPILAAFSSQRESLEWARDTAKAKWGQIQLESPRFDFRETDYYADTMGRPLLKQFWAFAELADPQDLTGWKLATNGWESESPSGLGDRPSRTLNLDPGYISSAKLVLASTKDHAHRIYLADGIYAEVTLRYQAGQWAPNDWTFPDYRRDDYRAFFTSCRQYLRQRLKERSRK